MIFGVLFGGKVSLLEPFFLQLLCIIMFEITLCLQGSWNVSDFHLKVPGRWYKALHKDFSLQDEFLKRHHN